jgi:hypothetical protein
MAKERNIMCFTDHDVKDLSATLEFLKTNPLQLECFDAFLYDYKRTGDLSSAIFFARCEWDV